MKIQIGNEPYIDRRTGKPVEGRLSVYLLNTDIPATTYALQGNNGFVECVNPMLLHSGLPDESVFVEVGLYGLKIEKYIGPEGQMSAESPDEYFEQIDYLEAGMDFDPQASSANVVNTIEDLQQADPALGSVTVLWHTEVGDCTPRTYVWDAGSRDNIDGGYVVGSDVSDEGHWILVWGDEILPCTFYGVIPGREANLNLLLNYPATVGSFRMATAPCVRFVPGDYTSDTYFATDKELVFDGGARFVGETYFQCPRARVLGTRTSYVCDLGFTAPDAEAHSSWFKTLSEFWHCGAKFLYCDTTNYFKTTLIAGTVSLADKVIYCNGRLPATYSNGAYFTVGANTCITGRLFNSALDFVRIMSDGFGDEIFARTGAWDPGLISAGHHIQYDSTPDLDLFESTDRWVKTMVERRARISSLVWSDFTLDLQNRRLDNINPGTFTEIRNGTFNRLTISGTSTTDITLRNVKASDFTLSCRYLIMYDSDVSFQSLPSLNAVWAYDSRVHSSYPWTDMGVQVVMERCEVGISFHRNGDNTTLDSLLQFTDCNFQENVGIYTKHLEMFRCKTTNNAIKVYPYKDGSNVYHLYVVLEGNLFNSNYPVEFTKIDTINGYAQEDVYDCVLNWKITGNTFLGNDEGLRMRYWQNRTGSYWSRTFVKPGNNIHSVTYEGNVGKCPSDNMRGVMISDNKAYTEESVGSSTLYKYAGSWKRCLVIPGSIWWQNSTVQGPNTLVKWYNWVNSPYNSVTYSMFVHTTWFAYPKAHDDPINNGDFFANAILLFGDYLRIVQRGDGDRNDGVVGKVI